MHFSRTTFRNNIFTVSGC